MRVTRHAYQRIKERIGLPKRAAFRLCAQAFCGGVAEEDVTDDEWREWIQNRKREGFRGYLYRGNYFIFACNSFTCVTVLELPTRMREAA